MIIHNATIHSPVERFATALHVEDGVIVWMGDEDTAKYRAEAYPEAEVLDAHRCLITPTFHDSFSHARRSEELHARGVTAAHVHIDSTAELAPFADRLDAIGIFHGAPAPGPSVHLLGPGASAPQMRQFLQTPRPGMSEAGLVLTDTGDLRAFEELVSDPQSPKARVYVNAGLEVNAEDLHGWSVVVLLDGDIRLRVGDLSRLGIPFAVSGTGTAWETITQLLVDGPAPISSRAGFNAHTRGAWRLTPRQGEPRGILRVGAPADLAWWEVNALAVQAPDEHAAFWSTDQRAGTPLLPALGAGEEPPRLARIARAGGFL